RYRNATGRHPMSVCSHRPATVVAVAPALAVPGAAAEKAGDVGRSATRGPGSAPAPGGGGKLPAAGARVQVRPDHAVVYDLSEGPAVRLIHVAGTLTFARDRNTRLDVGLIKIQAGEVREDGFDCEAHLREPEAGRPRPALEVGTADEP